MARVIRRTRFPSKPPKEVGTAALICKGVIVSFIVALLFILFLSIVSLVFDGTFIEHYMKYIMVGITMISIFIGSAYAAQKAEARGLIIGIAVGTLFVLVSVGFGLNTSGESIMPLVVLNKFLAGIAAGALGGLIGVNL